ncbi:Alpha/Beta hydrolase protein, partial [Fennellomyces sp. T-0311]
VREATAAELEDHIFYAKLSAAAYCKTVIPLGFFNCKHCDKSLKLIKTFTTLLADTNAMVLRGDQQKTIYVVFRGTNSINSFVVDAIFTPVDYPIAKGTKVHKGFLESYNEVRDKLVKVIQEQVENFPDYKVAVTGHSLGGSQALLCALDLFNLNSTRFGVDKLLLHTQGQPRTGDPRFAKYVTSTKIPFKRVVSKRDLIPHIPTPPMFLHAGEEFWITGDDKDTVKVCPDGIETPYCANSIAPFTNLLDHLSYFDINMGLC